MDAWLYEPPPKKSTRQQRRLPEETTIAFGAFWNISISVPCCRVTQRNTTRMILDSFVSHNECLWSTSLLILLPLLLLQYFGWRNKIRFGEVFSQELDSPHRSTTRLDSFSKFHVLERKEGFLFHVILELLRTILYGQGSKGADNDNRSHFDLITPLHRNSNSGAREEAAAMAKPPRTSIASRTASRIAMP